MLLLSIDLPARSLYIPSVPPIPSRFARKLPRRKGVPALPILFPRPVLCFLYTTAVSSAAVYVHASLLLTPVTVASLALPPFAGMLSADLAT